MKCGVGVVVCVVVAGCGDNRSAPPLDAPDRPVRPVPSPDPPDPVSAKPCRGTLSFGPAETVDLGVTVDFHQRELQVMDLDGDGHGDLVFYGGVTTEDRGIIATRRGLVGGGFEATTTTYDAIGPSFVFDDTSNFIANTLLGDVDNDGRRDLLVLGDTIQGVRSPGDGTLIAPPVSAPHRGTGASMATGDFDGDGIRDVLTRDQSTGQPGVMVQLFHGIGDGTFAEPVVIAIASEYDVYGIAGIDVDNDGNMDVIVAGDGGLELLRGHGDGTFDPSLALGDNSGYLVAHDVDGDGLIDLVSGSDVFLNAGDGTFLQPSPGGFSPGVIPVFGDLDGDGHLDIVIGGSAGSVTVQFGRGDGSFDRVASFDGIFGTPSLVDVDGDGVLDIVGPGLDNTIVSVLRGHCE